MRFNDSARTFHLTIIVASITIYSGTAGVLAAAATAPGQLNSARQSLATPRALTRASGFRNSGTRSTGDVIVSAAQGVFVYSSTLAPVAEINVPQFFGHPAGLALDASGNLYVANFSTKGIPVYKNDYQTLVATLNDPNGSQGIAVAKNGIVGVVDVPATGGHITFFASGSTTPCASIAVPNVHNLYQGAFDTAGNFYVTGMSSGPSYGGIIGVIRGGCSATGFTILSTANSLGEYLYGIQVNRFGKILVGDQSNRVIYTYDLAGVKGALGQPIAKTALPANTNVIFQFGFTTDDAFLFIAQQSLVSKYKYPAGGKALQAFGQRQSLDDATGLVIAPPS